MSKTIMIKEETYSRLKHLKSIRQMSFTELLDELMEKKDQRKNREKLLALAGTWKSSPEDKKVELELKEGWKKWNKKYA